MRVSIFKCVKASIPLETELDKIVHMMCFSPELSERTQMYRQYLEWSRKNKRNNNYKRRLKSQKTTRFPAFAPCAKLNGGSARKNVTELTDLCYLDIDHINEAKQIREAMEILRNDPNVVMASMSVSGIGLHILVRYQLKGLDAPKRSNKMTVKRMQEIYAQVYGHLAVKYYLELGLLADMQAGHMEHLYIVSYDPFVYYNPAADPLMIDLDQTLSFDICPAPHIDDKQEIRDLTAVLDDSNGNIAQVKEKINRAYEILTKVEENFANNNYEAAFENIAESNRALRGVDKPYQEMLEKVRTDILETSQKVAAANRVTKEETQRQKSILRGLVMQGDYKQASLYIIEKLEAIQMSYDAGDLRTCKENLMIINAGLGLFPEDDNKAALEAHYEKWKAIVNDAKKDAVS